MQADRLIALLGRKASDPAVEQALASFKIRRRPEVEIDEDDVDGPVVRSQAWVKNAKAGIEFGFEEEASWLGKPQRSSPPYEMVLTQLYFYGYHHDVQPYIDQLPLGLLLKDDRARVRAKLARFEQTRRSWVRDTWELPDYQLIVSYAEDGARIGFVLVALRVPSKLEDDDILVIPKLDELIAVLGRRMDDPALRKAVRPLSIDNYLESEGDTLIAVMREEFGIDLWFGGVDTMDGSALTNIVLYREREEEATAWKGSLPSGLTFGDSPEVVFRKMKDAPADKTEDDFVGYAVWHLADYSVQVKYSTMHNWISSVQILAPGVWDSY